MELHYHVEGRDGASVAGVSMQGTGGRRSGMVEERLPFTVRIVRSEEELGKAVDIRHAAYARHVPAVAALLTEPEPNDREDGSVVLLAESKLDGTPLGTMRIQTNQYGKLVLEQSIELPDWLQGRTMAEVTRLGVSEGRIGRLVKTVLVKAGFQYCMLAEIDWIVITARSPLDKLYHGLLFQDIFPNGEFIPMRHVGNIPHRVLAFEVDTAYARWAAAKHPLFDFMCNTLHPDIRLVEGGAFVPAVMTRLAEPLRKSGLNPWVKTS